MKMDAQFKKSSKMETLSTILEEIKLKLEIISRQSMEEVLSR